MSPTPRPPSDRIESDSFGPVTIPGGSPRLGANTVRGVQNFSLGSRRVGDFPTYVRALLQVKAASARANVEVGVLPAEIGAAIEAACLSPFDPADFPIDMLEGSGGTSTNMNVNEVLANRALGEMGREPGDYTTVHPNDHVNLGQSTNDVVPTALKLATIVGCRDVVAALGELHDEFQRRRDDFASVLRTGRTCLQAAQPMTLGQAFGGYAAAVGRAAQEVHDRAEGLLVVPLGATAIGTGLGAAPGFRDAAIRHLRDVTGLEVTAPTDWFDAAQNADSLARVSAEMRTIADLLAKIATDIIVLSSAPDGRPEISIPAVQAGSSIMPGKVNPVMPMMMQQVAYRIVGNDASVSLAAQHGQLEINHFEPLMALALLESTSLLANAVRLFREKCVAGIAANETRSLENLMTSPAISTAFVPELGYEQTAALVKRSVAEDRPFVEVVIEEGLIDRDGVIALLHRSTQGPDA